jgi:hypothetical protein
MICAAVTPSPSAMMMNTTPLRSPPRYQQPQQRDDSNSMKQPFFLMDWLEEFVSPDQDVYQLAELLQTPGKLNEMPSSPRPPPKYSPPNTPKSSNRKKNVSIALFDDERESGYRTLTMKPRELFKDNACTTTTTLTTNSTPQKHNKKNASSSTASGGQKHSLLALGNGWNAKGLKKAQQGLWKDALACWDVALELRLPTMSLMSEEVANTWNNRGIALGKLGDYSQALESLNKALEIRLHNHKNNGKGNTKTSVIISTYHNIANVHQQAGAYNKALAIFGLAKSLCYQDGDAKDYSAMVSMARLCTAMGHVYYQAEQWIDARDAYFDAVWVYQQLQQQTHDHQAELKELRRDVQEIDQKLLLEQQQQEN